MVFSLVHKWLSEKEKRRQKLEDEHQRWKETVEPQFRKVKKYPEDWQKRRLEVYRQANGRCNSCGHKAGTLYGDEFLWFAHVHHKTPLLQGGDHSLSNLELLCEFCHIKKHPRMRGVRAAKLKQFMGKDAAVRRARRDLECLFCKNQIMAGEYCYGGRRRKLCMNCYEKF